MKKIQEILSKYNIKVLKSLEKEGNSYIYTAILSSSSVVIFKGKESSAVSIFPCDISRKKNLHILSLKILEEILKVLGIEGKDKGIVEYYDNLGNILGVAAVCTENMRYIGINAYSSREDLESKNIERILEEVRRFPDVEEILYHTFGEKDGYSMIIIGKEFVLTVHTWPEYRVLHMEEISKNPSTFLKRFERVLKDFNIFSLTMIGKYY